MKIEAIITDFDGTLVDTFVPNYLAYKDAFKECGLDLTREQYSDCYGLRFDEFMDKMGVIDKLTRKRIKLKKADAYPDYFNYAHINMYLAELILSQHNKGIKTAIASTASSTNLKNLVKYLNIESMFDYIITGDDVKHGKPNPEVYNFAMQKLEVTPEHTLIFEDSEVGIQAAEASKANWIKV